MPQALYDSFYAFDDAVNPYGDCCMCENVECDYVIPTPDVIASLSTFNVPAPVSQSHRRFSYTLNNGTKLEFEHPLPPGIPVHFVTQNENTDNSEIDENEARRLSVKHFMIYSSCIVCPFAGLFWFKHYAKKDPAFANRIRNVTLSTLTAYGTILLILL